MRTIEVSAKSLDEAKTKALLELSAPSDRVKIEVLEEGTKGVFGLFGKDFKIRATVYEEGEKMVDVKPAKAEAKAEAKAADKTEAPKEFVTATGETVAFDDSLEKRIREANAKREKGEKPAERRSENKEFRKAPEKKEAPEAVSYEIPADAEEVQARLKAFLLEVLTAMGVNATVTTSFSEEGILDADIESADEIAEGQDSGMGVIIGKRGNTLDSLQYLATLVLNKGREDHLHIKLDTEGYRKRRQETLENLARNTARKVKKSGRRIMLDPMNPYERRIIHSALQNERGIETYSEGEEPYRKVVIAPIRSSR